MAGSAKVGPIEWADGDHHFHLRWGELIELQGKCDAGPAFILSRMFSGHWLVQDISEVIRLGLIGAGMAPTKALELTRTYVEARPPDENLVLAIHILRAAVTGLADGEELEGPPDTGEAEAPLPD